MECRGAGDERGVVAVVGLVGGWLGLMEEKCSDDGVGGWAGGGSNSSITWFHIVFAGLVGDPQSV